MNKVMTTLNTLDSFASRFEVADTAIDKANSDANTTLAQFREYMNEREKLRAEFDKWMMTEFEFPQGPVTLPKMLKRVVEKVTASNIILPGA